MIIVPSHNDSTQISKRQLRVSTDRARSGVSVSRWVCHVVYFPTAGSSWSVRHPGRERRTRLCRTYPRQPSQYYIGQLSLLRNIQHLNFFL